MQQLLHLVGFTIEIVVISLTFQDNLSVPSSEAKNRKESPLSQYRVYTGKIVGGEK
jgi:hypothetical protein